MTSDSLGAILLLIAQMNGTPYIPGGHSPAGTDCSGLASIVANAAAGRDPFSGRFTTANAGPELAARGFAPGSAPGAVVVGWNSGHAAVTLPDGTNVSSGESGSGVRIGGGGAYQPQFTRHMYRYLPAAAAPEPVPAPPVVDPPAIDTEPVESIPPIEELPAEEIAAEQPPAPEPAEP